MTGSLQAKRGKYFIVLSYKDSHNKWKQKWVSTGLDVKGNKRRALDMLPSIIAEYSKLEKYLNNKDILFSDYLIDWLYSKKDTVELSTWESYKTYVEKHIVPYFEKRKIPLIKLSPKNISDFYEYEFRYGKVNGTGGVSIRSIRSYSLVIKQALNASVVQELIGHNPANNVPLPKREEKRQISKFLTVNEANDIIKLFEGHVLQRLIYVTLCYGLRRSEVLGLKWSAIDFNTNTFVINHTVVKNLTTVSKDKTKTSSSNRVYYLLSEIRDLFLSLKKEENDNKFLFKSEYIQSDYVFKWPNGKPFSPDFVTKSFQRVLINNGYPKLRFHDLRHSTASILHEMNWDLKDIQAWLGHSDIRTTSDVYTHISNLRKEEMSKRLENKLILTNH